MHPMLAKALKAAGQEILRASRKPLAAIMRKRAAKLRKQEEDNRGQA